MSGWLSVGITVILIVIAYVILNRNIASRTTQQAALDEIKREVGSILTELNSASERNIALIEDKIRALEALIEEADRRIVVLRRESTSDAEIVYRRPSPARVPPHRYAQSAESAEPAVEPVAVPPSVPRRGNADDETSDEGSSSSGTGDRVERLYLQGLPLERIASIVGLSLGEVELIISLREGSET